MRIKCAFDREEGVCDVLNEKSCEKCSFFKSKERLEEGRAKAEKRIKTLPQEQQDYIYDRYYSKRTRRLINESKEN